MNYPDDSLLPVPMDPQSLRELLDAFDAGVTAVSKHVGPDALIDVTRMFLLAAAGWHETEGKTMPPSKHAVRTALGLLAGVLRANGDM
jgi:hypothetical protein